jgi:hypothetical protein
LRESSPTSLFSYDSLQPPSPATPQSPISSPNQSQQSLLHQKLSSLIRLGLGSSSSSAHHPDHHINTTKTSPSSTHNHSPSFAMSPSKSVVQYLNDKFLRKRHSVSILKFSNSNTPTHTSHQPCQPATSTNLLAVSPSLTTTTTTTTNTSNVNHKLEKSVSNQSFLFNTPQIRLDDGSEAVTTSTRLKVAFSKQPQSSASASSSTSTSKSNAVSRSGSFKVKKKTKRSKSAPINQRKILVNSTFFTLLSTNYGDSSQLSPAALNRICVLCENKQHNQTQCHIFK